MPAKISSNFRNFSANAFVNVFRDEYVTEWLPNEYYSAYSMCTSNSKKYISLQQGVSGSLMLTHSKGIASDGNLQWLFVENLSTRSNFQNSIYFFTARTDPWFDEDKPDEPQFNNPEVFEKIINYMRVKTENIQVCVPRYNWVGGRKYSQFDPSLNILNDYEDPFYVLTDNYNIYKCLDNNNGAQSVTMPTGQDITPVLNQDGYVWKYMGHVDKMKSKLFLTDSLMPVSYKSFDDNSVQWRVQQEAKPKSIGAFVVKSMEGSISNGNYDVIIEKGPEPVDKECVVYPVIDSNNRITQTVVQESGSGYNWDTFAVFLRKDTPGRGANVMPYVNQDGQISSIDIFNRGSEYHIKVDANDPDVKIVVVGDGHGAMLTADVNDTLGTIDDIHILSPGNGYTWARAFVLPSGHGAVSQAIMGPINGHGSNIIEELGAHCAVISVSFTNDDVYFKTGFSNAYRQAGLITGIKNENGDYCTETLYIGDGYPCKKTVEDATDSTKYDCEPLNKTQLYSGQILYLDNFTAVERADEQLEIIKISIFF